MWDFLAKLATAILGSAATALFTRGAETMLGPRQPSRRDVSQDLAMQRQFAEPIRTPEQTQADQQTLAMSQQREQTFQQLSKEYGALKERGTLYDPLKEQDIRREALAEAEMRFPGSAESGQTQEHVRRRLETYRLGQAKEHEGALSNLRQEMLPYTAVQAPSTPPTFTPSVAPQPRQVPPTFRAAPFDIAAALMPERPKKPEPGKAVSWYE